MANNSAGNNYSTYAYPSVEGEDKSRFNGLSTR